MSCGIDLARWGLRIGSPLLLHFLSQLHEFSHSLGDFHNGLATLPGSLNLFRAFIDPACLTVHGLSLHGYFSTVPDPSSGASCPLMSASVWPPRMSTS